MTKDSTINKDALEQLVSSPENRIFSRAKVTYIKTISIETRT